MNRDRLDNRKANLRFASSAENARNSSGPRSSTSRYKGVSWYTDYGKWRAAIGHNGRFRHIGYFSSEEDAARAYDEKARELFGDFAATNF